MSPEQILLFSISGLFLFLGILISILLIRHNGRLNTVTIQKNNMISEARRLNLEENERLMNQISREVHDNIGQSAHFIRACLRQASRLNSNPEIEKILESAAELTERVVRDARNVSHSLNQNHIKAGNLHYLLEQDLSQIRTFSNITFDIDIMGKARNLVPDQKLVVYRIAQEAFHNILKHSGATEIKLVLEYQADSFKMTISDNGNGLPQERMHARDGIGMHNMRERAAFLNGTINLESNPGNGFAVQLLINPCLFFNENKH